MKLTVVRHGETVENAKGILMGHMPGKLTPKGIREAKALGKRLADVDFNTVYVSDLKRCRDTAEEILKYHPKLKAHFVKELRERDMGVIQGKKRSSIDWDEVDGVNFNKKLKGGESLLSFRKRVEKFVRKLAIRHKDEHLLVVAHSGVLRMMQAMATGKDLGYLIRHYRIPQDAYCRINIQGNRMTMRCYQ